jgi:hypothetical protein
MISPMESPSAVPTSHVVPAGGLVSRAHDDDDVGSSIGGPIATSIETMPADGPPAARGAGS